MNFFPYGIEHISFFTSSVSVHLIKAYFVRCLVAALDLLDGSKYNEPKPIANTWKTFVPMHANYSLMEYVRKTVYKPYTIASNEFIRIR